MEFKFVQMKGQVLFKGGNHKNGLGSFTNFLLQNHWASFNQTCHKSSLEGWDLSLFKGRRLPLSMGDNSKRVKIHCTFLKIFFRTIRSKSIKLGTNYP
jgi:hypothetical protein